MTVDLPPWLKPSRLTDLNAGLFANRRWRFAGAIVVALLLSISVLSSDQQSSLKSTWSNNRGGQRFSGSKSDSVFNETLGFQKIFAIGMKERTDKKDAMELAASISDMDITWSDGVATKDVLLKSVPANWKIDQEYGLLGSWRAHMNVLKIIVKQRIQSALILEDDVDWDINVKSQLAVYAQGVRTIQRSGDTIDHPYGTDWDLHWIGNCRGAQGSSNKPVFIIYNDTTVPPIPHRSAYWKHTKIPEFVLSNTTRVVHDCGSGGLCTYAYAVTFNGAQKILSALFSPPDFMPFDKAISVLCADTSPRPFQCYGIYPPLLSTYRFAGATGRNSDSVNITTGEIVPESSQDLVYSTRMNAKSIITGALFATSQWNDTAVQQRPLDRNYLDEIKTEVVTIDWNAARDERVPGINAHH